jgi:hypothetical protein
MYIMYVDESGDTAIDGSPTDYFVLSGLIIHELRWLDYLNQLVVFRKMIRDQFGLKLREEIHAGRLITRPKELSRIPKYQRLAIIRLFIKEIASMGDFNLINILVHKKDKDSSYDVFENAWRALFQRFENTIRNHNFPGPRNTDDKGLVIPDNTNNKKLITLLRKLRHFNPIPNTPIFGPGYRDLKIEYIIEDPNFQDSKDSYFVQAADLAAFLLYQYVKPNSYIKEKSADKYFERLDPILCKQASPNDPFGIVHL